MPVSVHAGSVSPWKKMGEPMGRAGGVRRLGKWAARIQRASLFPGLFLLVAWSAAGAAEASRKDEFSGPLWLWKNALERFQEAGRLIGQERHDEAVAILEACVRDYPFVPYGRMAGWSRDRLERNVGNRDEFRLNERLGVTCEELLAYREAAEFYAEAHAARPDSQRRVRRRMAWCLAESGAVDEAVDAYRQEIGEADSESRKKWCAEAIELITQRREKIQDIEFITHYIRERYERASRGSGPKSTDLAAMRELMRILPLARDDKERVSIYFLIIARLEVLWDNAGLHAWEDKLLEDFPEDADACAKVCVLRGQRAYKKKNLDEALENFRTSSTRYPDSKSYGIAQYNVGIVLNELGRLDESIAEFAKLFPSNVNDRDPGAHIMETSRNYRYRAALRISECYEAKGDYKRALKYALLARDKYPFRSWCGTCLGSARSALAQRISRLRRQKVLARRPYFAPCVAFAVVGAAIYAVGRKKSLKRMRIAGSIIMGLAALSVVLVAAASYC